ncbi:MAG: hypothetical protein B6I24_02550 [Bacteroidetes bacterium 4572_128]|nr:MAG: hypothetical protein B6I24_02550 [Bacteroidetes bacterium 4572_128]
MKHRNIISKRLAFNSFKLISNTAFIIFILNFFYKKIHILYFSENFKDRNILQKKKKFFDKSGIF